jgi:hypothetical protein
LVGLGGVLEQVDRHGFIKPSKFELVALETCIQVSFHKLLRENIEGHQPIQRALIIFIYGFDAKNGLEQISQLDHLDGGQPLEEVFILLREGRKANVFNPSFLPINVATRIRQADHAGLQLSCIKSVFVVSSLNNNLLVSNGSGEAFHGPKELFVEVGGRTLANGGQRFLYHNVLISGVGCVTS